MKVLVTGGCGMIGSHVASYYHRNGDFVVAMDNLERSALLGHDVSEERKTYNRDRLKKEGVLVLPLDVSDYNDWNLLEWHGPFDAIVHCAAQCGVPTSIADPVRDFEINALGTLLMLEKAREWNSKVVYASTNKVYPIHSGWVQIAKKDNWRWIDENRHRYGWSVQDMNSELCSGTRTPYGASKYSGDCLCQEYAGIYGVKTGVFRMSCIYGEHQMGFEEQGWATWFAIALRKGLPITVYGDGYQVRDMLHVSDVVRAYDAFIQSNNVNSGVWNLGGGPRNTLSIRECIDMLQKQTGRSFGTVEYKDWRPSDQRIYTSDIRELKKVFDWEPLISPEQGMQWINDWVDSVEQIF